MFKIEKQKEETVNKTFRFPLKLIEELQTIAQNNGVSLNYLVQKCCEMRCDKIYRIILNSLHSSLILFFSVK